MAHIANCLTTKKGGGKWKREDFVKISSDTPPVEQVVKLTTKEMKEKFGSKFKINAN